MREPGATPQQLRLLDRPADAATSAAVTAPTRATHSLKPIGAAVANATEDGFFARWSQHKLERLQQNAELVQQRPDELAKLVLGAVPGVLLMLVPLFALCLKLLYARSGRGYLEHLL